MPRGKSASNSYFKLDGAQQSIKLSINQLIFYAKHSLCGLSILKFADSNRIDRLEVRIVFHEKTLNLYNKVARRVSTFILSSVFSVFSQVFCAQSYSIIIFQVPLLLFICYNSFFIIHVLYLISNSYYQMLYIYAFHVPLTDGLRRRQN